MNPSESLAKKIAQQIENKDPQCAFWVVSFLDKLYAANPKMTVDEILYFIDNAIPKAVRQYESYINHTI